MPHTLFIADLHLSDGRPDITHAFLEFMRDEAPGADALYVLGDLFEFWVGDDEPVELNRQVAAAFRTCSEGGTPVYYIHGNRDFMIGRRFAAEAGMTLLPEHHVIDLYGEPVLIMHGDTLCTDDAGYQRYRRITRWRWLQWLFLCLPLRKRLDIADGIRGKSAQSKQGKNITIMDVNRQEVARQMRKAGVKRLIHGHTHRPAMHDFILDGQPVQRLVLGDWYTQGSVLRIGPDHAELQSRELEENR
ncbi:UDP-2,3-diacylglucosamine diphosphatase [Oceanimonas baumannii]|uniref:UDP-2,3-diacylglucosamine hydrolase n=1 Tax=Oceanimonas baumannii TaxID=129578 RepID=A0A235CL04_9GAMM|nr:UDP-2,3-diacylglucosamine diphosphatase [Oceanimonas baumannii]MCC4265137.1 UDP-2,3-diacylglucosamine diphosphatase [Oceanimonas baumannii]OYD25044.1 UDP-2,3-diacylglucosamine diphosphatase [Oceanimonas baumannii]TDW59824.1 UDP-2,3-diacylglucosamine hydrolase [Oceanimonas baumannii]